LSDVHAIRPYCLIAGAGDLAVATDHVPVELFSVPLPWHSKTTECGTRVWHGTNLATTGQQKRPDLGSNAVALTVLSASVTCGRRTVNVPRGC